MLHLSTMDGVVRVFFLLTDCAVPSFLVSYYGTIEGGVWRMRIPLPPHFRSLKGNKNTK